MEFMQTKNYGNHMDVVFNGDYYFIDGWYGLVAIATRREESIGEDPAVFDVDACHTMNLATLKRMIGKSESKFIPKSVQYDIVVRKDFESLPFNLKFEAVAR